LVGGDHTPSSWSPDGLHLATVSNDDIWIVTVAGSTPTVDRLAATPETERWPEFSPDGHWLAYGSNVTGHNEVYIQPWPGPGAHEQVSLDGGRNPAWNPSGRELFFVSTLDAAAGRSRRWVVDVETGPSRRIGTPRALFDFSETELPITCRPARCYAVSPQGDRFFVARTEPLPPTQPVTQIRLVQGWLEEMKASVSGKATH
jgi:Tol biopolymer transport system component